MKMDIFRKILYDHEYFVLDTCMPFVPFYNDFEQS